ncbi:MFS general substrate transporter [Auriscalpium vulgare]|uniref:MFS general substrate transporter n=1 Tax=Auriscalpium vulgare TaxID=40419 RepID=A0ACB8R2S1_9AGAM|nr:MFS general substrate transporter [Auriscalpium vulgare]
MSAKDDGPNELLPKTQPRPAHDGVRVRAWITLFGAWLDIAATFGYMFTFGIYQDIYTRADVASASGVRWIGATQFSVFFATSLPAGLLHDSGHGRTVVNLGSFMFTFSLFMLSFIDSGDRYFKPLFTQGIAMGIGAGLVCIPSLDAQADHWGARSTLAMGVASTGLFAGGTFFSILLTQLLHHGVSSAWNVRASAFVVLGMLLVANACMRRSCPRALPPKGDKRTSMVELVTDAPYMCAAIGALFTNWGIYFTYFYHLPQAVIDEGMDRTFAFYTPAILCGAAVPGGIFSNLVATKCGTINAFPTMSLFCLVLTMPFLPNSIAGVAIIAPISGIVAGAWISLLAPVFRAMSTNTRDCGARLGFAFAVSAVAVLIGTPVNDWLLGPRSTPHFEWAPPAVVSILMTGAGAILCGTAQCLIE